MRERTATALYETGLSTLLSPGLPRCPSIHTHTNFSAAILSLQLFCQKMVRGRRVSLLLQVLCLALVPQPASAVEEYEYYSWQLDNYHSGRFSSKQPQCVDIPSDLRLCHDVGYKHMRLPNLLEHESMAEVKQQAGSWVPLLAKHCHSDTQMFLCSLFAPVCLDRPIYPCRTLCEAVRDSCAPVMETYGFPWPDMLQCHKFPTDNDMCIPMRSEVQKATQAPDFKICPPCDSELKTDVILEHFCASDFVLRMKIKQVKKEKSDRKLIAAQKKKKLLKSGELQKKDLKKLVLHIKNGANCQCEQLDKLAGTFLIMGRRVEQQYLLTAIYRWDKNSMELRYAVKHMKTYQCPIYHDIFH